MSEHRFRSEKEIKQGQREKALHPYKKGATLVGKGIFETGKLAVRGLQKLGKEGQKPRPKKKSRPSSYESQVRSTLTKAQKIKVAREKRLAKRRKALKKRLS